MVDGQSENVVYKNFVALGDSFTEGVGDPDATRPNGLRGWADRVAEQLAVTSPELTYANLAIRGRLLDQIIDEQIDAAIALHPDLVTIYAGGNDLMRPSLDIDAMIARYDAALGKLAATGAQVVVFSAYDSGWAPVFGRMRPRAAVYNELLREVVDRHGLTLLDFWRLDGYDDYRMWDTDRLHMSALGHERMAAEVLDVLDVAHAINPVALEPQPGTGSRLDHYRTEAEWVRTFLVPWISRRVRGVSSGDGIAPRWPAAVHARTALS
ncbi:SGNH/GDSL hydrolase family protein [Gordonia sp. ABSL1-1]|uniref:SGNH/GDSL hydrolase family protein n=1 Tax=Gordonia sp. ABSL1-1 TaxID=3053923 RepID=UPI0025745DD4|nr:SGNH/GDSL hydrolase family protein [Gordonia sp. ABSL1-1]MDL9937122.1 SGNH/GDSL hydrolase family protein [Gordonia sp. ABSL1-1]